jgi:dienelactone hydrolase
MSFLWYWPAGGWSFDAWKKSHPWEPVKSEQSGRHDFLPLKDFEKSKAHWRQISDAILGKLTDKPPAKPHWEWLGDEFTRERAPTYTMRRLRYRLTDDEWGYAWLLVPKDAKGRTATVIALHQTHPHGKDEPVGLGANPDSEDRGLQYGVHLVERGFIVFAPDAIAFGERSGGHQNAKYHSSDEFFAAHPEGSVMRKMQYDVSRAIDVLEQMPNVDADRIGCIGHSHGAYGTLFAMLGEDRIKAGVISCGFSALRFDPKPERWWRLTALMPRLGFYEGDMDQTPIDFHVWIALLAPRPVMIIAGTEDTIFPNCDKLPPLVEQVRSVYASHGAEAKFIADIYKGPHNFPRASRETAYKMLREALVEPPQKAHASAALGAAAVVAAATVPATKTYRVPETRLPFVNGEIAQVNFQGKAHLVSAVWAASAGGRLYFWDPVSKTQAMRMLPAGAPGAYMLKTAADGNLYIGDGNGDLHRYITKTDQIETMVRGQMHSITWGGCATDRYIVWSTDPGEACVYDWRENKLVKKFAPVDSLEPHAHYGHNVVEAPDGRVILFMDVPQLHLCIFDPKDLSVRSVRPESLRGHIHAIHASFFDEQTLLVVTSHETNPTQFLSYPDLKLIETVPMPKDYERSHGHGVRMGDQFYAVFGPPKGSLWRISNVVRKWELVQANWLGEETGYLGQHDNKRICAITDAGTALSWDSETGKTDSMQINNPGQMDVHAMCVVAERNLIIGAPFINARFWTIDLTTGQGTDQGRAMPGAGQINQIVWDAGRHRALLSAYVAAAVTEYDPAEPAHWPKNPRVIASASHEQQMRPRALLFDRRHVWMATSPTYGKLGGALSRIDPETDEIKIWRNIVPDQTINSLALDLKRRRIYLSSEIYADMNSAPPTQSTAQVVAFDMDKLEVTKRLIVRENAPKLAVAWVLADGRVLIHENNHYYAWNPADPTAQDLGTLATPGFVVSDRHGNLWSSIGDAIGLLTVDDTSIHFTSKIPHPGTHLQIEDDTLYYAVGATIYATPLENLL